MPISEAPAEVNEPKGPAEPRPQTGSPAQETSISGSILGLDTFPERDLEPREPSAPVVSSSRWIDYNTHELLEMIGELEDERRWSRLREGFWLALLIHILFFSAITWIPTYIFKVPKVIDPFEAIKERKDLAYLDLPPDALRQLAAEVIPKPAQSPAHRQANAGRAESRVAASAAGTTAADSGSGTAQAAALAAASAQTRDSQVEAPRPAAVPARPSFAMGSQNPADQLKQDMQNAMHNHGGQSYGDVPSGGLSMHPGAGTGGVQVLSDTQGVDFSSWLARWHYITQMTWDPLIPDEVNPPILKSGVVVIHFKVLPNGQVTDMQLDGRSGDPGLDRAAWGAITGSSYPNLPREFHGPYLELRAYFLYNMEPR